MTAMPPYPVHCTLPGCGETATYKIATQWSDGVTSEMKTYALCCEKCLKIAFQDALRKRADCPLEIGETLGEPGIFELGESLIRCVALEVD